MHHLRADAELTGESVGLLGIEAVQGLDGDVTAHLPVEGPDHPAHGALAEGLVQLEAVGVDRRCARGCARQYHPACGGLVRKLAGTDGRSEVLEHGAPSRT